MGIRFTKMQAYGNDYVYVDAIHQKIENPNELSIKMSNRHFGIGADGLVLICPSEKCDFRMRIFNPDGTEAEMCGNAVRSTGKFVYYHGLTDKTTVTIETLGGDKTILHRPLPQRHRDRRCLLPALRQTMIKLRMEN